MTRYDRVVVILVMVIGPACRSDVDADRLAKLEARLGAVESDLNGRLAPRASADVTLAGLELRISQLEALGKRVSELEAETLAVDRIPLEGEQDRQ